MESIFTLIVFVSIFSFVIYSVFSKQGRKMIVNSYYGNITNDLGEVGVAKLRNGRLGLLDQKLHLYECKEEGEDFYVLEVREITRNFYAKIPKSVARKLGKIFEK